LLIKSDSKYCSIALRCFNDLFFCCFGSPSANTAIIYFVTLYCISEGTFLQPNAGDHLAISRQPSGLSTQSMDDHHSFVVPRQELHDTSRMSSFSGQFSVDPV